jgi:processive 1,2-diacylglycerol beta-glucosyltransferase
MACSDILITKSGALSTTEALTRRLPMILFGTTPGQEGHNADYFIENGAALRAHSIDNLLFKVDKILQHPGTLESMKRNAGKIRQPRAAQRILDDVISTLS